MSLDYASKEMKNNEEFVLAAVKACGGDLKFASEEMRNKESVVLAAVQQDGCALEDASEEMQNKESVVLAAVQQNGRALEYASEEMQNKESVVLAAVQQDTDAFQHASEEMKNRIRKTASTFGVGIQESARGMLNPMLLQVRVSAEHCTPDPILICQNMNGEVVATVTLDPVDELQMLRQKIADAVHPPNGPVSLNIILPGGQRLQDLPPSDSVRKWL